MTRASSPDALTIAEDARDRFIAALARIAERAPNLTPTERDIIRRAKVTR